MLLSLTLLTMATITQALEVANTPFAQEDPSFYPSANALPASIAFPAAELEVTIEGAGATLAVASKPGSETVSAVGTERGLPSGGHGGL